MNCGNSATKKTASFGFASDVSSPSRNGAARAARSTSTGAPGAPEGLDPEPHEHGRAAQLQRQERDLRGRHERGDPRDRQQRPRDHADRVARDRAHAVAPAAAQGAADDHGRRGAGRDRDQHGDRDEGPEHVRDHRWHRPAVAAPSSYGWLRRDAAAVRRVRARGRGGARRRPADRRGGRRRRRRRRRRADARPARARARGRRRGGRRALRAHADRRVRWRRWPGRCAPAGRSTTQRRGGPARRGARRRDGLRAHATARRSSSTSPPIPSRRPRSRPRWRAAPSRRRAPSSPPTTSAASASLVDVGGGRGVLLAAILEAAPHLKATLVDRAGAVEAARAHVDAACIEGDFFDALPAGADAYLLSRVLHDWDDEDAPPHPRRLPCRDARARAPAGRRRDPARAGQGRAVRDPDGPAHAADAGRARAHRGGVPRAARRRRVRGPACRSRRARPRG